MKRSLSRLPVSRARASSTSRSSSSTQPNTPSLIRSKSSLSLRRTPQSVQSSCKGGVRNKSAERGKQKKKEVRPIQDKKWQSIMLERTQYYFQQIPEARQLLNKGVSIRPITLNMFVQLTNIVLKNIDSNLDELALSNYTELLPIHLNTLMYPGTVTASTLKTANTMHSWPHILAILSWLVELHELSMMVDVEETILCIQPGDPFEVQLKKSQTKTILEFFEQWNKGIEIETQDEILENMHKKLYNYSEDDQEQYAKEINKLYEELHQKEQRLFAQQQELLKFQEDYKSLEDKSKYLSESFQKNTQLREEIASKILDFKNDNENIKKTIQKKESSIEKLKEIIKKQPMDIVQRTNDLKEIDDLNRQLALLKEKKKHQLSLRDEKDIELSEIKRKNEQVIHNYNIELMRPALQHNELNSIKLREDKLLQSDMEEFIKKNIQMKQKLMNDLELKVQTTEETLSKLKDLKENKQEEIQILNNKMKEENLKQENLTQRYESLVKSYEETEKQNLDELNDLKQQLLKIKEVNPSMGQKVKQLKEVNARCDELKSNFYSKQAEMEQFFEKIEEEIRTKQIHRYDNIRKTTVEKVDNALMQYYTPPESMKTLFKNN